MPKKTKNIKNPGLDTIEKSNPVIKPAIYVQQTLLQGLKALARLNKYVDTNKRLTKTELRELTLDIRNPLMRASGYVFPDEEL